MILGISIGPLLQEQGGHILRIALSSPVERGLSKLHTPQTGAGHIQSQTGRTTAHKQQRATCSRQYREEVSASATEKASHREESKKSGQTERRRERGGERERGGGQRATGICIERGRGERKRARRRSRKEAEMYDSPKHHDTRDRETHLYMTTMQIDRWIDRCMYLHSFIHSYKNIQM